MIDVQNYKNKKFSQNLLKHYFINLSKFSQNISEYGLSYDEYNNE